MKCHWCRNQATGHVQLLMPDGQDDDASGFDLCDLCVTSYVGCLIPTYYQGEPTYRVDKIRTRTSVMADDKKTPPVKTKGGWDLNDSKNPASNK